MVAANSRPRKLRVGAVSYLNTKPLIHQFDELARNAELILDYPSRLADRLALGDLDVALIPSIECLQHARYEVVSDACIACRGPVLSVKLLSRVSMDGIRTLALDEGSRTSVALVQILLRQRFRLVPALQPLPLHGGLSDTTADAVLLIGDRAIHAPRGVFPMEWDLGAEWYHDMGVPFVFAMWAAREGIDTARSARYSARCGTPGSPTWNRSPPRKRRGWVWTSPPACPICVTICISSSEYRERRGLQLFRQHAAELGLVQLAPESDNSRLTVT